MGCRDQRQSLLVVLAREQTPDVVRQRDMAGWDGDITIEVTSPHHRGNLNQLCQLL